MIDKNKLLKQIYEVSFAVNDMTLYLDTHPNDSNALATFRVLKEQRKTALTAFEESYYPLTIDCMTDDENNWTWGEAPAPWLGGMTNVEL